LGFGLNFGGGITYLDEQRFAFTIGLWSQYQKNWIGSSFKRQCLQGKIGEFLQISKAEW